MFSWNGPIPLLVPVAGLNLRYESGKLISAFLNMASRKVWDVGGLIMRFPPCQSTSHMWRSWAVAEPPRSLQTSDPHRAISPRPTLHPLSSAVHLMMEVADPWIRCRLGVKEETGLVLATASRCRKSSSRCAETADDNFDRLYGGCSGW
jgi:hypothetical protein